MKRKRCRRNQGKLLGEILKVGKGFVNPDSLTGLDGQQLQQVLDGLRLEKKVNTKLRKRYADFFPAEVVSFRFARVDQGCRKPGEKYAGRMTHEERFLFQVWEQLKFQLDQLEEAGKVGSAEHTRYSVFYGQASSLMWFRIFLRFPDPDRNYSIREDGIIVFEESLSKLKEKVDFLVSEGLAHKAEW